MKSKRYQQSPIRYPMGEERFGTGFGMVDDVTPYCAHGEKKEPTSAMPTGLSKPYPKRTVGKIPAP